LFAYLLCEDIPVAFNLRLLPRQENFFELLRRSADNVQAGCQLLLELVENAPGIQDEPRRLKDLEHVGDEITHEIFSALDRSFVTPLDRDDIAHLASALDDVIDWAEDVARRMYAFGLLEPTPLARGFARLLADQSCAIARSVAILDDPKQTAAIRAEVVEIHRLENQADDLMLEALQSKYASVTDLTALVLALKWAELYEVMEQATDKAEQVGTALESILLKRS
jgi:uncharacterized protein